MDDLEIDAGENPSDGTDVAVAPNEAADPADFVSRYVPADVLARYEVYSYRNAALILSEAHPEEFSDLIDALRTFTITTEIISKAGGNESDIPKIVSKLLRPLGWHETTIQADLLVKLLWRQPAVSAKGKSITEAMTRELVKARFLDEHKVDYVKGVSPSILSGIARIKPSTAIFMRSVRSASAA